MLAGNSNVQLILDVKLLLDASRFILNYDRSHLHLEFIDIEVSAYCVWFQAHTIFTCTA